VASLWRFVTGVTIWQDLHRGDQSLDKQEIRKAHWFDLQDLAEAEERQYQEEFQNGYDDRFIYVGYDPKVNSKAPHYIEGWRRADADCREGVARKRS
jgi:hypothetical protein